MRTSWLGLEIALRALQAQQAAISVAGHNVANANTPGYSRQKIGFEATTPLDSNRGSAHPGMVGTGVSIAEVTRYRNAFLDRQYRQRNAESAAYEAWVRAYDQIEGIFREPSDSGLRAQMDRFWSAMQSLVNNPDQSGSRTEVVESARTMLATIQDIAGQLGALQKSLDQSFVARVDELNQMLQDVAELNQQIFVAQSKGQNPNDLMDKRDMLTDEISRLVGGSVLVTDQGQYSLAIGGRPVIHGNMVLKIDLEQDLTTGMHVAKWEIDGSVIQFAEGELAATQGTRDQLIPTYADYLATWSKELVTSFNSQHQQGYYLDSNGVTQPGTDFFTHDPTASGLEYLKSLGVAVAPWQVAAAEFNPVLADDAGNARKLLDVLNKPNMVTHPDLSPQGASLQGFYETMIADLGVASRHYRAAEETARLRVDQAANQREGVSGVSIDEEMTRIIQYQHAYTAAARVMTTVDTLLETLVSRVGLVGR